MLLLHLDIQKMFSKQSIENNDFNPKTLELLCTRLLYTPNELLRFKGDDIYPKML